MGYIEAHDGGRLYRCDECEVEVRSEPPGVLPPGWREYWPPMLSQAVYSCVCPNCELVVYNE